MQKVHSISVILLISLMIFVGCSGDEDENPVNEQEGPPPAEMVGSWIFLSATVDGVSAPLDSVLEWQPQTVEARLHIQANSAYVFEEVDTNGGQLWFESGWLYVDTEGKEMDVNSLLDSDGATNETVPMTYTLVDTTFTLTQIEAGSTIVLTLTM